MKELKHIFVSQKAKFSGGLSGEGYIVTPIGQTMDESKIDPKDIINRYRIGFKIDRSITMNLKYEIIVSDGDWSATLDSEYLYVYIGTETGKPIKFYIST